MTKTRRPLVVVASAALVTGAGCSLLVGAELSGGEATAPTIDANVESAATPIPDAGVSAPDAEVSAPDAALDGGLLAIRGFSKTARQTATSMAIQRPPGTRDGDVILAAVRWAGTFSDGTWTTLLTQRGCGADAGASSASLLLWVGYRVATASDPVSWTVTSSSSAAGEAIAVAVGDVTVPPDDFAAKQNDAGAAAEVPSILVQRALARVVATYATSSALSWGTPAGLERITNTEALAIFSSTHPSGSTPTWPMPAPPATVCSLSAAVALPARP